ncbi:MAG: WbqC family protein, partial [Anaerolineales bacterium]
MKCVILQPSYIPWRGFFHQIQRADLFVFYDDVQYDKLVLGQKTAISLTAFSPERFETSGEQVN